VVNDISERTRKEAVLTSTICLKCKGNLLCTTRKRTAGNRHSFVTSTLEMSGQLHTTTALPPMGNGCAIQPVWTLRRQRGFSSLIVSFVVSATQGKAGRQCVYNGTLIHVRTATVAVDKQRALRNLCLCL